MSDQCTLSMVATPMTLAATLAAGLLAGCGDATGEAPAPRRDVHTYTVLEGGARSRVERAMLADGSEALSGETRPAAGGRAVIRERVEIGADGRLRRADVLIDTGDGQTRRVVLDPARGAAYFTGGQSGTLHVPTGEPWSYALPPSPTPIAAWVTVRAAASAPSVRLVDLKGARSDSVMSDQLVVRDGDEAFVVLGDDVVPAAGEFVGRRSPASIAWSQLTCRSGSC
ncbi:MAG: hypothetical protein IT372_10005 [Polyangiaceae bacterium]|nr:hypothetical protein [Polyangiaceae bacterium]